MPIEISCPSSIRRKSIRRVGGPSNRPGIISATSLRGENMHSILEGVRAHGNMGLELSEVLLVLHEAKRLRHRYVTGKLADHDLSGIEIGFLRTVGDLLQASMYATVMVVIGAKRLAKRDLPQRKSLQRMKAAAGLIGVLADATHRGNYVPSTATETSKRGAGIRLPRAIRPVQPFSRTCLCECLIR